MIQGTYKDSKVYLMHVIGRLRNKVENKANNHSQLDIHLRGRGGAEIGTPALLLYDSIPTTHGVFKRGNSERTTP